MNGPVFFGPRIHELIATNARIDCHEFTN